MEDATGDRKSSESEQHPKGGNTGTQCHGNQTHPHPNVFPVPTRQHGSLDVTGSPAGSTLGRRDDTVSGSLLSQSKCHSGV
ncbi:hypothetical protein DPEC_G00294300 [Dallia pectoralis]|uniref:Uncharacterized protein n=1 Tax=Dallia pectoralis TaxID=75939 RepID=A0ACC2FIJ4_DALPE|nr:hypothetical protein DPEC_G00294300 [Dallia pectoralis]